MGRSLFGSRLWASGDTLLAWAWVGWWASSEIVYGLIGCWCWCGHEQPVRSMLIYTDGCAPYPKSILRAQRSKAKGTEEETLSVCVAEVDDWSCGQTQRAAVLQAKPARRGFRHTLCMLSTKLRPTCPLSFILIWIFPTAASSTPLAPLASGWAWAALHESALSHRGR